MKYLAAYMLVALGGATPSKESVSELLSKSGVEVDASALDIMMAKLDGKDMAELLASGKEMLLSLGGGGGAAGPGGAAAGDAAEEEVAEVEEEAEVDLGGGDMFGDASGY